jgi:hypothetical protein
MRRLILLVALVSVAVLGFGAALVLAGSKQGTPATGGILICHADSSSKNPFVEESPDASSILGPNGHSGHPDDIIPAFYYLIDGTQYFYPGMNTSTLYDGFTGAEVLANGCVVPTSRITSTQTVISTVTTTLTETETVPGEAVTVPPETVIQPVTVTVSVPEVTVTTPGTTTVVTVPAGQTTTVTLPAETVTLPASTVTTPGETVDRPPVTVTQPGTVQTITAGATPTVATVTAPHKTVQGGVLAAKKIVVTVTGPTHVVHVPPHVIHEVARVRNLARKLIVTVVRECEQGGLGKG